MAALEPLITIKLNAAEVNVSSEDIDDIMDSAMSGCTYWCGSAEPLDGYLGEYASEQISKGGKLKFYPLEDEPVELTLEAFECGLCKWLKALDDVSTAMDGKWIDPGRIDSVEADSILQYALFGDIIYG